MRVYFVHNVEFCIYPVTAEIILRIFEEISVKTLNFIGTTSEDLALKIISTSLFSHFSS